MPASGSSPGKPNPAPAGVGSATALTQRGTTAAQEGRLHPYSHRGRTKECLAVRQGQQVVCQARVQQQQLVRWQLVVVLGVGRGRECRRPGPHLTQMQPGAADQALQQVGPCSRQGGADREFGLAAHGAAARPALEAAAAQLARLSAPRPSWSAIVMGRRPAISAGVAAGLRATRPAGRGQVSASGPAAACMEPAERH